MEDPITILPAEWIGTIVTDPVDGCLPFGNLRIPWTAPDAHVYVRRESRGLTIIEIAIARHDGLAQEELDAQNDEAEHYPLGAKEYWRGQMVGKYTYGGDGHLMTHEDFEEDWGDA